MIRATRSVVAGFSRKPLVPVLLLVILAGIWGFIEGIMLLVNGGTDVNGVELV